VHISNEGMEVITYIDRLSKVKRKSGSFGPGVIGNRGLVVTSLGLPKVR
jgi:hypothetical protein